MFANDAEWPDELAFERGDLLRVLDQRPAGGVADGWWLCADRRGRRGIAPANRLHLAHPFRHPDHRLELVIPRRFGDVFRYNNHMPPFGDTEFDEFHRDSPFTLSHGLTRPFELSNTATLRNADEADRPSVVVRDIPIKMVEAAPKRRRSPPPPPQRRYFHLLDVSASGGSSGDDDTTTARPSGPRVHWRHDTLPAKVDAATALSGLLGVAGVDGSTSERSSSLSGDSNRSSLQDEAAAPRLPDRPTETRPVSSATAASLSSGASVLLNVLEELYDTPVASSARSSALSEAESVYDVPKPSVAATAKASTNVPTATAPLGSASQPTAPPDVLQSVEAASARLQRYASQRLWRSPHILQANLTDIRLCVSAVCQRLSDLVGGVDTRQDERVERAMTPLCSAQVLLCNLLAALDGTGWTLAALSRPSSASAAAAANDLLDQFVAVCRQLPEDCRRLAAVCTCDAPLPPPLTNGVGRNLAASGPVEEHQLSSDDESQSSLADYDFIDSKPHGALVNGTATTELPSASKNSVRNDEQIFDFYNPQVGAQLSCLSGAIERFLTAVEEQNDEKSFVGQAKLVILAAHKVVYLADSVAQCLKGATRAMRLRAAADALCNALKECVGAVKAAAKRPVTVANVQTMVDSVVRVSQAAHDIRLLVQSHASTT